jgi:hypothetical protein
LALAISKNVSAKSTLETRAPLGTAGRGEVGLAASSVGSRWPAFPGFRSHPASR